LFKFAYKVLTNQPSALSKGDHMAKVNLTPGRIAALKCESGQSFLWDSDTPGLGVRATPGNKKAYIIQSRFNGKAIRITIGDVGSITLEGSRVEAKRLLLMIEQGIDPREQKRKVIEEQNEQKEVRKQRQAKQLQKSMKVSVVWDEYIKDRKAAWGKRHHLDHIRLAQSGDTPAKIGGRNLKPGPLAPLLQLPLDGLTSESLETWLNKEIADRPAQARLALKSFKAFLAWCADSNSYKEIVTGGILTKRIRGILPKQNAKDDCLQKEQLQGWFGSVRQIQNPIIAAYLQGLLLTGSRREELSHLRWEDIDFRWKSLTIRDKVEGQRIIPLTPYFEQLLRWLPKRNSWVFSSPTAASGRLQEPRIQHNKALTIAGIDKLTLHGLRRSFGTLAEWIEVPVGVVAQIQGHKPSAIAEKHYRVRPLDLLRMWHVKIEEWILDQAGIEIPSVEETAEPLRLVSGRGQ
jgi:integrase